MRTTLSLDDDVLDRARTLAEQMHSPFRLIVNEALRAGLRSIEEPSRARTYSTHPHKMGLKAGRDLDNIQELLSQIEGEDHR